MLPLTMWFIHSQNREEFMCVPWHGRPMADILFQGEAARLATIMLSFGSENKKREASFQVFHTMRIVWKTWKLASLFLFCHCWLALRLDLFPTCPGLLIGLDRGIASDDQGQHDGERTTDQHDPEGVGQTIDCGVLDHAGPRERLVQR